jgi:hypothetical protein
MPVRKIPKNYLFVTGGYSSQKSTEMAAFESLLEKDYLLLLDFDNSVERFDVQPVRIPVEGVHRGYVPDALVFYHPDTITGLPRQPELVDVKNSAEAIRNAEKYRPKFAAAKKFASERGWVFKIVDETQIRTPRLANLKFLRAYRNVYPDQADINRVLNLIQEDKSSSEALLSALAVSDEERLHWLPIIWSMLLSQHLVTGLDIPFSGDVPIFRGPYA